MASDAIALRYRYDKQHEEARKEQLKALYSRTRSQVWNRLLDVYMYVCVRVCCCVWTGAYFLFLLSLLFVVMRVLACFVSFSTRLHHFAHQHNEEQQLRREWKALQQEMREKVCAHTLTPSLTP